MIVVLIYFYKNKTNKNSLKGGDKKPKDKDKIKVRYTKQTPKI